MISNAPPSLIHRSPPPPRESPAELVSTQAYVSFTDHRVVLIPNTVSPARIYFAASSIMNCPGDDAREREELAEVPVKITLPDEGETAVNPRRERDCLDC
jgi:hypothetical protein